MRKQGWVRYKEVLNNVRKSLFHATEVKRARDQKDDRHPRRDCNCRSRVAAAQQCPAESLDHADHWVQSVYESPLIGKEAARVGDRRRKHPQLGHKGNDIADIAVLDIQGCQPEPDTQGQREC